MELIRVLRWVSCHRGRILAGLGALTIGYGVLIAIVPWRFCHTAGYVITSIAVISLLIIDASKITERHDNRR